MTKPEDPSPPPPSSPPFTTLKVGNGTTDSPTPTTKKQEEQVVAPANDAEDDASFSGSLNDDQILPDAVFQSSLSINDYQGTLHPDAVVDHLPAPPDGGYGWVIVAAAFASNFIVDGVANSFGPFMQSYQQAFGSTKAAISLIGSILIGAYLLSGPIAGGLLNKYEARKVVIGGTLLASLSFAAATFSPNIFFYYVLYGLLGGIGFGFIYLPAIVMVSQYFESKRALATGIAVSGSGLGTCVLPILSKLMIERFSWEVAVYFNALLVLSCVLCGVLYKPLPVPDFDIGNDVTEEMKRQHLLAVLSRAGDGSGDGDDEEGEAEGDGEGEDEYGGDGEGGGEELGDNTTLGGQTASPVKRSSSQCTNRTSNRASKEDARPLLDTPRSGRAAIVGGGGEEATQDDLSPSTPMKTPLAPIAEMLHPISKSRAGSTNHPPPTPVPPTATAPVRPAPRTRKATLTSMTSDYTSNANVGGLEAGGGAGTRLSRQNLASQLSRVSARSYAQSLSRISQAPQSIKAGDSVLSVALSGVDPKEFARPLSRRDIFYQGSIRNLKEFEEGGSNFKAYRASNVSIPLAVVAQSASNMSTCGGGGGINGGDNNELSSRLGGSRYSRMTGGLMAGEEEELALFEEQGGRCTKWIPLPIRNAFSEMVDVSLLKDPLMLLLCCSNTLAMLGFYVPFVYTIGLAQEREATASEATFLLSIIGMTNTIGRIFFGWLADRRWASAIAINNFSLLSCGLMTCACPFLPYYGWLVVYAALFGFMVAAYICLTSIVLSDLLGVERLTNSFGLLVVARGIGCVLGTPFAGIVYEFTDSFYAMFIFAGSLIILSGVVSCVIPNVHRYERSKLKNEGDYQHPKSLDAQSVGKLSVLTERSEENASEYLRTIQSIQQQRQLIKELEDYKRKNGPGRVVEEPNEGTAGASDEQQG